MFGAVDDPSGLLMQEYHAGAQPRVNEAVDWMNEVGPRWNDDVMLLHQGNPVRDAYRRVGVAVEPDSPTEG